MGNVRIRPRRVASRMRHGVCPLGHPGVATPDAAQTGVLLLQRASVPSASTAAEAPSCPFTVGLRTLKFFLLLHFRNAAEEGLHVFR